MMAWTLYMTLLCMASLCAYSYLHQWRLIQSKDQVWSKLEVVGASLNNPFSLLRAIVSSVTSTRELASRGYAKFSTTLDRPYALPTTWVRSGLVMVLPPSLIPMMMRPDKREGGEWTNLYGLVETIQLPYLIKDPEIYQNVLHFDVVRRHMTTRRDLERLSLITADELDGAFHDIWGTDPEWKLVNGWEACGKVISRASQRILIGLPWSRDETLLETSRQYANSLLVGGAIINCFPPQIRWLVAPLVTLRARYYQWRFVKMLLPLVNERIRLWEAAEAEVHKGKQKEDTNVLPDDFLQWMIPICAKDGPEQLDPRRIALRLVSLLTPLIFAVCYVFAHCVLDIHGSPLREDIISALEEECIRVSGRHGGQLRSSGAVDEMLRVDSALRESMRTSDVAVTNLFRDVTAGEIDIGNGIRVGQGVRMVFPTQNVHLDANNYPDPTRYDAFRFSRPFEQNANEEGKEGKDQELITTTTTTFLPFGYG